MDGTLDRRLGLSGSVAVGMSAMVGAGLFVVFAPAVDAAGNGLLVALGVAAVIAGCNAMSSARLARLYPVAGGTYVYGRERLGPFWGHLAGWSFIAGKLASCAVVAVALGSYLSPHHSTAAAVLVVAAVTGINLTGVQKSAAAGIVIVAIVLTIVLTAVVVMLSAPGAGDAPQAAAPTTVRGVLEAAGLLFFAFAGYARLATLGEEVRRPGWTIPRAILISFVIVVAVYAVSAIALRHVLGPADLAASSRPFVTGVRAADADGLVAWVVVAAALAAGGAILSLVLGVSRTMLAMGRDGHLPQPLASIGLRHRVPYVAEVVTGLLTVALVLVGDLTSTIAFSSFCVLVYYAVANASALTLGARPVGRLVPAVGVLGCVVLAVSLPRGAVVAGSVVVLVGALSYAVRRRTQPPATRNT